MIRYITLRSHRKLDDWNGSLDVEVVLADSKNTFPDMQIVNNMLHLDYYLPDYSLTRLVSLISLKLARYVYSQYPYVLSTKVVYNYENGNSIEYSTDSEVITDGGNDGS